MFQLTLGPADLTTAKYLAEQQHQRLRRCLCPIRSTRTQPRFRLSGSLTLGRLQLAGSCTVHPSGSTPARCRSAT